MKTSRLTHSVLLLALSLGSTACSSTGSVGEPALPAPQEEPEMSPEAMMAMMMEMANPGPEHELLAKFAGSWKASASMWMDPAAPPEVSEGSLTNTLVLGGRYVMGNYESSFMGMPFSGISVMGFDRAKGKYHGTWMDTFSTGMLPISEGDMEDGVLTLFRTAMDGVSGEMVNMKEVSTWISDDEHTFEMFSEMPDGWVRNMKIVYTRR